MTLPWHRMIFADKVDMIFGMFPTLSKEDQDAIRDDWANQMFEDSRTVYLDGEKYVIDGQNRALSELQKMCMERAMTLAKDR